MIKLYKRLENIWFVLPQKLRFLLVGGFNTIFSYLLFAIMVAGIKISYQLALIIGYIVSTNVSIFTQKYYVFRSLGNLRAEYIKAWSVYLLVLLINYVAMYIMVDVCLIDELVAQALYVFFIAIFLYAAHSYFSFSRRFFS